MMDERGFQLRFFGLRQQPFAPTADPSYFYATREHKSCLFRLWASIDERLGIAVVLGNYGTGKTTLLRKLMTGMAADPSRYNTAVIASPIPSWTSFALLEAIIGHFKLKPSKRSFVSYMEMLNQFLLANRNRVTTLIIDDAQNLNKRGQLELLRLAQNLETPQHKLLNLVFFAQLEWTRVLRAAPNFQQRVNMTYMLEPLGLQELREFLDFRIKQAGGNDERRPEFDESAVETIHQHSGGNPRVIVTVSRNALLFAAQVKTNQITRDVILHTIAKTTLPDEEVEPILASSSPVAAAGMQFSDEPLVPSSPPVATNPITVEGGISGRKARADEERANELLIRAARAESE